jgi:hypothetical protein
MPYKKYAVRSPLFALKDPRLSAQVLAAFSGALRAPVLPPRPAQQASSRLRGHIAPQRP